MLSRINHSYPSLHICLLKQTLLGEFEKKKPKFSGLALDWLNENFKIISIFNLNDNSSKNVGELEFWWCFQRNWFFDCLYGNFCAKVDKTDVFQISIGSKQLVNNGVHRHAIIRKSLIV